MSKKVVFLGCENYHARQFLTYIKENPKYQDIEVLGCHSELDKPAQEKLANDFNIKQLNDHNDCINQADAVVVTARHGDYHLKFAKEYIKRGIPAFIDKPITIKEEEAIELAELAKANNVKLSGRSSLMWEPDIIELKKAREELGCIGGFVRAPVSMDNAHGGFFFYCEHLIDMVLYIFGSYPNSVIATDYENGISIIFKYDDYEVNGVFSKDSYFYGAGLFHKEGNILKDFPIVGNEKSFEEHFDDFYETLSTKENKTDYKEFISPVFVYNAVYRSMSSHKEEKVRRYDI